MESRLPEADPEGHRVADVQLFQEDVVQSVSGRIGMVTRVGGDSSDSESSDSEDDDEDREHDRTLAEGCARIVWIDSPQESVENVTDLQVVDRAFLHGDIVALASEPLGQTGTVIDVEMSVDLEVSTKEVVRELDSHLLRRVRALAPGDNVIHGHWLGRVEEVLDNVTVVFEDGSKCKVHHAEPGRLVPSNESLMDDTESPYYPGQRVRAASSGVFKNAKWLRGSWKANRMEGSVVEVEAGMVIVYWIAVSALHSSTVPSEEQDPRDLVPMTFFTHTNWQIGDRAILPQGYKALVEEVGGKLDVTSEAAALDLRSGESAALEGPSESTEDNAAGPAPSADGTVDETGDGAADDVIAPNKRKTNKGRKVKVKAARKDKHFEKAALVVNTRTRVDILWQDGSKSSDVNSCSLVPVEHLGDHDFWPEQFVIEQGPDGDDLDNEVRRVGILKSVDAKQRTAIVRWLKPVARPEELREFGEEETVSVYELIGHPDYAYCLGDVVIRLSPAPCGVSESQSDLSEASVVEDAEENEVDASEKETGQSSNVQTGRKKTEGRASKSPDLSWVGIITGLQDGDIEVHWANGLVSKVGPQAVFVVTRDEDDMSSAHTSDLEDEDENDGDDAASWTTVDSAEQRGRELGDGFDQFSEEESLRRDPRLAQDTGDEDPDNLNPPRFRGPIAAAIGLVSRMANGLLGLRGNNRDAPHTRHGQGCARTIHGLEEILDDDNSGSSLRDSRYVVDRLRKRDTASSGTGSRGTDERTTSSEHDDESQVPAKDELSGRTESTERVDSDFASVLQDYFIPQLSKSGVDATIDKESHVDTRTESGSDARVSMFANFKHFDIVSDPSDHHYVGETAQASQRRWAKKIQSEWTILEKNLPDTIYVRVYEERMDLLRAVILGAPGTPYHDGLFVFDLYLPPEYPHTPPQAYYHSGGLRLNPNLYENGKVCLSLLNTWSGKGTEVWDPQESSILQVLVSIQGLVLNTKPYFNEAGYDRQVGTLEGEKNSVVYNENSFLLSCKSMLYLIRRPPMHFEDLIRQNFLLKGAGLLRSCEAYLQGAPVGSLVENKNTSTLADTELIGADKSSAGFKLMLTKLVLKLKEAFKELGVAYDKLS